MVNPFSTNPFDSPEKDFPDPLNVEDSDESENRFFDCQDGSNPFGSGSMGSASSSKPKGRSANINFDKPFEDGESPALDFHQNVSSSYEFFSPLESAMMTIGNPATGDLATSFDSEGDLPSEEHTPLLDDRSRTSNYSDITANTSADDRKSRIPSEISADGRRKSGTGKRKSAQSLTIEAEPDRVMKELAEGENEFSMDYKYILLEDLGTRSSWIILLLPYIAFCICLMMESSIMVNNMHTQVIPASNLCSGFPSSPSESPCHFAFHELEKTRSFLQSNATEGVVFESGVITNIPLVTTYLYGDAFYGDLSTAAVSFVAHGQLEASVELYQKMPPSTENPRDDWALLFVSEQKAVSMACDLVSDNRWNCRTPRLVNVVFSMPDTAVFAGGDVFIKILYSANMDLDSRNDATAPLHVYTSHKSAIRSVPMAGKDSFNLIEEIVASSEYGLEHMSEVAMGVDTGVRLVTFAVTLVFFLFWLYNMGVRSLFGGLRENFHYCFPSSKTSTEWWESHWILFPERYYIILLLVSLLLVQEPLLAAMVLSPAFGASAKIHIAADATIGIGVHGILFVYHCLLHGFRYHTAVVSKKRSDHKRQILQLRRAAKYVSTSENPRSPSDGAMTKYADDFYDVYGDIDGNVSNNHRLQNDPFGDGWADFLLLKLLLFLVGAASVLTTAYCRFPPESGGSFSLDIESINAYRRLFVVSSSINFIVLLIWIFKIITTTIETGRQLRAERFLATRPVQLAMRVILAHLSLGFTVLAVTFYLNAYGLATKWSLSDSEYVSERGDQSDLETAIQVISQISLTFPYSGTAASVGGGRVLFATVSILITAFIFLPARTLEQDTIDTQQNDPRKPSLQDKRNEQWRLKRDKRLVVHLAKEAKTWRVFPVPIDQSVQSTILEDSVFQIYKDLHIDGNKRDRGIVSIGPYTPVFCLELACWLNEASWQAYFSPKGVPSKYFDESPGMMNLQALGLHMEGVIYDETTDTQVFVATNVTPRVDGEEDSVIVVSFRGTASTSNLQTDLRSRQIPLLEQLAGVGSSSFRIHPDRLEIFDEDGWIWNTPQLHGKNVQCVTSWSSPLCMPSHCSRTDNYPLVNPVSHGAKALLQAAPLARDSFPLVHEGFQEVYTHIRRKLLDIVFPVMQRQLAKSLEIHGKDSSEPLALPKMYLTGHSLGGSLAQLLALDLSNNCEIVLPVTFDESMSSQEAPPENDLFQLPKSYQKAKAAPSGGKKELRLQPPMAVYSFGQPRVGNKQFSRFYKQRVPHTFRVVNEGDAITSMPNRYFCGGVYKHSGLEVLLDEGMTGNILVGPTVVETMFRFSPVRTNMLAHTMTRYRDCLECAFEEHELLEYYQSQNVEERKGDEQRKSAVSKANIPDWMTHVGQKRII